ncbi:hypothetical protein HNQ51_002255 [Inhella inkyongensis]|uniref:Uncharacterized protein n=1 Tax=Inhella inkyongensis TaxID=392593 RepID=A0A840S7F0_9BURK|nr:hypothetical protein [Inhella inkyongensis]
MRIRLLLGALALGLTLWAWRVLQANLVDWVQLNNLC